ncbi:MAG: hypothetical protein ACFBSG_03855 [Leptolyngbyaceae cyanobacterium]
MLVQLVRPLVRSQIQTLANTSAADTKLSSMVAQWLGYLGVHAEVTRLETTGELIAVSLRVGKPEQCNEDEWRKILDNITRKGNEQALDSQELTYEAMTSAQQRKVHRLLACVLRAASDDPINSWDSLTPQLIELGLSEALISELRAAVRVDMPMELLVADLEPEVASFALSKAIAIALMDKHINQAEDDALEKLLDALQQKPNL